MNSLIPNSDGQVSIIVPAYKAEELLPQALESIARQTYRDWELIVVEDAWPDQCEFLVKSFRARFPQNPISFIRHEKNQGLGATRNTAMRRATGRWIAFLDHDDIWDPTHLEEAVAALETSRADISYSTVKIFDGKTGKDVGTWGPTETDLALFPQTLFVRNFIAPSCVVLRSSLLNTVGYFATTHHGCEDHDYWLRAVAEGCRFAWIKTPSVRYRQNNQGALTGKIETMLRIDLGVMKSHLHNPQIRFQYKRKGLSENYGLLGEAYFQKDSWQARGQAIRYLLVAYLLEPWNLRKLKRCVRVLTYFMSPI